MGDQRNRANVHKFIAGPLLEFYGTESIENMPSPRFYRTHISADLLQYSKEAKYIWVIRNPKDCLVSSYHFTANRHFGFEDGDFYFYFDLFVKGEIMGGDYFDHALSWYKHRNDPNVLCVYYEGLQENKVDNIIRIAKFLGSEYEEIVKDQHLLDEILHYSTIDYMKKFLSAEEFLGNDLGSDEDIDSLPITEARKYAMRYDRKMKLLQMEKEGKITQKPMEILRKGIVGGWTEHFTDSQNNRIEEKIEERLGGTELLEFWEKMKCLNR